MALVVNINSYVTVAEADAYFDNRIDSANWVDADTAIKEQALITATLLIDENNWVGQAVSSSQALAWPRSNAQYYDKKLGRVITPSNTDIPDRLKIAVYEQALHLVDNEDILLGNTQVFESISVGSISLVDNNNDARKPSKSSSLSLSFIKPLLKRGGANSWWRAN